MNLIYLSINIVVVVVDMQESLIEVNLMGTVYILDLTR